MDLMPDGQHRQYTNIQECKSVVTTPSGGQVLLDKGFYNITGLAWSGRGAITRVDVSIDGGKNWQEARLSSEGQDKALSRFYLDIDWQGEEMLLQSRAMDSSGYVQPTKAQLREVRGLNSVYHNNCIQTWHVYPTGEAENVEVS